MKTLQLPALLSLSAALAACGGGSTHVTTNTGATGSMGDAGATPTASLTVNSSAVNSGAAALLTWSSTNATTCEATGGWSGTLAASGTQSSGALSAATTFTLTCSSASESSAPASVTVSITPTVTPLPTVTLAASPDSIAAGASSTLTWSSTDATSCTGSGGWTGTQASSGTVTTAALTTTTTYGLTCTGAGGTSAPAQAVVTVDGATATPAPTVNLAASPTALARGATSTLTWSSTNATTCTASGGWTGTQALNGTVSTAPITTTSTYTLTCSGTGGTSAPVNAQVTVTAVVTPPPTVTLSASPTSVAGGGSTTLTWSSTNATTCTASGGWAGTQATGGTAGSGALSSATTFGLACTGSGGTANASTTVAIVTGSMNPRTVALVVGQTRTFTQTLGGVTYSVDGINGGNAQVGTVSNAGLYTAGTTTGAHTLVATSTSNATQSQSATALVTDLAAVATYHQNTARTGANTQEYALTTATVAPATFGKLASCAVDGVVIAQPLWAANVTVNGAAHNVVYVATQHDSLYAIDADAAPCTTLWRVSLADTAHGANANETAVPSNLVGQGYGDVMPEIGIVGTPVLDLANQILYVVSKTTNAAGNVFYTRLHALNMATGGEKNGAAPILIAGALAGTGTGGSTVAFDSKYEMQRPALALVGNTVYVGFSSHEDANPWFGWMFGYTFSGTAFTQTAMFNAAPNAPNGDGAGIWMSGSAPASDENNNLFLLTGNGPFNPANGNYGDSLLKLTPALAVAQNWTPYNQANDQNTDFDFGSGGAAVLAELPAGATYLHVLVCGGKSGILEILNRDMLGGFTGPTVQEIDLGGHGLFSTAAFWNNRLYVAAVGDLVREYTLNTSTVQFTLASTSPTAFAWPGATPALSASGTSNGIVWAMNTNAYCTSQSHACGPVILHAYDANNLATELWNSGTAAADAAGFAVKFTTPTVANGHVYVGTRGNNTGTTTSSVPGSLEIYGLKP